jgi:hypothetical protein
MKNMPTQTHTVNILFLFVCTKFSKLQEEKKFDMSYNKTMVKSGILGHGESSYTRRKVSIYHGQKPWLKGRFSWLMTLQPRFAYRGLSTVTDLSAIVFRLPW